MGARISDPLFRDDDPHAPPSGRRYQVIDHATSEVVYRVADNRTYRIPHQMAQEARCLVRTYLKIKDIVGVDKHHTSTTDRKA